MYGSSEVYRSLPDVLGCFAHGPAQTFSDTAPCKGLREVCDGEGNTWVGDCRNFTEIP